MRMKKFMMMAAALFMTGAITVEAQSLVLSKKLVGNWKGETVSEVNKPNGRIYRLRDEVQCQDLPLIPRIENSDTKMICIIAEKIESGWMALYRNELGANTYKFIAVLFDQDKLPERSIDLCEVSNTYNCEVQDIRWDKDTKCLLFNMACPSYASGINGKGSKLFCYDTEKEKMVWSTPYLTSNDIFILSKDYVFCGYGFTDEKDYIFMLDKKTGKIYSKLPLASAHQYMEIQEKGGKEKLYVVDYRDNLYIYNINKTSAAPKKPAVKKNVKK